MRGRGGGGAPPIGKTAKRPFPHVRTMSGSPRGRVIIITIFFRSHLASPSVLLPLCVCVSTVERCSVRCIPLLSSNVKSNASFIPQLAPAVRPPAAIVFFWQQRIFLRVPRRSIFLPEAFCHPSLLYSIRASSYSRGMMPWINLLVHRVKETMPSAYLVLFKS